MSYSNPTVEISPAFSVFGEGTFRYVFHETFDWSYTGAEVEKLTNEGWIVLSAKEATRIGSLHGEALRKLRKNKKS